MNYDRVSATIGIRASFMDQKLQSHGWRRDSIKDRLQEKIVVVSSKLSGMGLCFNVQLQESIHGVDETNMSDDSRWTVGQQGNQQGNQFLHQNAKVDFPKFDGSNSTSWFLRCNNYFKWVPNIPDAQKIKMGCLNLEGRAALWYKGSRIGQTELSWSQFVAVILARFENIKGAKILVEFSKLKHTGSYNDYVDKFVELKDRLMMLNQGRYTEAHFIASFIIGVHEDMQVAINFAEPTTLRQTIELGRKHLLSMEAITRELKAPVSMERNQETEMEDILLEFQDVLEKPTEFLPTNSVPEHQFLYRASQNHNDENERIQKEGIEMVYTPKVFDTLVERSFDPGGRHAFDVVFQSEMQVICVMELVKTKLEIGVEENEVDENLSDRLIEGEQNWTYQDLWKPVSVNFSSRDRFVLFDEFKVWDKILQVQESALSVKQWEMMCFDFCLGGFKSKVGADFISLWPLPKPPPMLKFYNGNSVVLKRREESVNIQRSKLVPPVKEKTEEVDEIVMRRSGCNVDLLASQSNLNLSNASTRVYHTTATWRNGSGAWIEVGYCEIYITTTGDLDFGYVQRDIDQWWSWTKIGIGFYGWFLGIAEAYNFYLGGGALDVSLLTTEEGILEVNDLLLLVVVEVVRCMRLGKMFDRPPPKPPFQFRHLSLGDKTRSRGGYCHDNSMVNSESGLKEEKCSCGRFGLFWCFIVFF